jgi:hypothetical protein
VIGFAKSDRSVRPTSGQVDAACPLELDGAPRGVNVAVEEAIDRLNAPPLVVNESSAGRALGHLQRNRV